MSNPRYPEEFKIQAVKQVTEQKLPVADVAAHLRLLEAVLRTAMRNSYLFQQLQPQIGRYW